MRKVYADKPFQVSAKGFALSPSSTGYDLYYSADGINYTKWEETIPANETLIVTGTVNGVFYKCVGNSDELTLTYDAD